MYFFLNVFLQNALNFLKKTHFLNKNPQPHDIYDIQSPTILVPMAVAPMGTPSLNGTGSKHLVVVGTLL